MEYKVILFYRYVPIEQPEVLQDSLRAKCEELSLLGRILLANEGINGTLAGSRENIDAFVTFMVNDDRFSAIDWKDSFGTGKLPFPVLSVKIVPEIVSSGSRGKELKDKLHFDPATFGGLAEAGKHLTTEEFHRGLDDPNCVLLDIRNHFEYDIGHFENAVNIGTYTYAETFDKLDSLLSIPTTTAPAPATSEQTVPAEKKIFMYCTGGVRCEKASAYLRNRGFENVYHLQGGIHRYLQAYPDGGKFEGKNFVFDSRVAMGPDGEVAGTAETTNATKVVGHCIDCNCNFDRYSGNIVCTVCRQPVLVCDDCVRSNPFPNEYYCIRHRDLKGIYLTILDNKPIEELYHQRDALQKLLDLSLTLANEKKSEKIRRRIERSRRRHEEEMRKRQRTQASVTDESCPVEEQEARASIDEDPNDDVDAEDATDDQAALSLINEGKHRRKTIRKQIERLNEKIDILESLHAQKLLEEPVLPNPKARCGYGFWES